MEINMWMTPRYRPSALYYASACISPLPPLHYYVVPLPLILLLRFKILYTVVTLTDGIRVHIDTASWRYFKFLFWFSVNILRGQMLIQPIVCKMERIEARMIYSFCNMPCKELTLKLCLHRDSHCPVNRYGHAMVVLCMTRLKNIVIVNNLARPRSTRYNLIDTEIVTSLPFHCGLCS